MNTRKIKPKLRHFWISSNDHPVDHRDSFTRNLEHLLAGFDEVKVIDRKVFSSAELPQVIYWFFLQVLEILQIILKPRKFISRRWENSNSWGLSWVSTHDGTGRSRNYPSKAGITWSGNRDFGRFQFGYLSQHEGFHPRGSLSLFASKPRKSFQHAQGVKITARSYSPDSSSFEDLDRKLFGLQYHLNPFYQTKELRLYLTFSMKAWHKDGATGEHPEPWDYREFSQPSA